MRTVNALFLTSSACHWLARSHQPRILHVFDRACNLINEYSQVLSIVTPQIGNGPFNVVLDTNILLSEHFNAEAPVLIAGKQLQIDDLFINTNNARLWNPRPDWGRLHMRRNSIIKQLSPLLNADYQSSLPTALLAALTSAIITSDIQTSVAAAQKLAGLGVGLTPSGDDFIMGALYAAWIICPAEIADVLANEIAETASPLTTSLAAEWLRSAGRGETGILWHTFFDALIAADDLEFPMSKILSVGETSGADALAGFLGVISAFEKHIPVGVI